MGKLSEAVVLAWQVAAGEAAGGGHPLIEKEHLFIGICKALDLCQPPGIGQRGKPLPPEGARLRQELGPIVEAFEQLGLDPVFLRRHLRSLVGKGTYRHEENALIHRSEDCKKVFSRAEEPARREGSSLITAVHLLQALLDEPGPHIRQALQEAGVEVGILKETLDETSGFQEEDPEGKPKEEPEKRKKDKPASPSPTPILDRYGRDLTAMARKKELPPLTGRTDELLEVIRTLLRTTKNNPVLIGEPGVGKTVIVEGLARRIVEGNIYPELRDKRLIELSLASLVAGAHFRGEFEERLEGVIREAREHPEVILFLDELHTVVGAGAAQGALDAANILKPALARGELRCIGATTIEEYRRRIEKDPALERRFRPILIDEPSREDTLAILRGLQGRLEERHGVKIGEEALEAAVNLSVRYLIDRRLPDKAIELLEDACVRRVVDRLSFHGEIEDLARPGITADDVAAVVAQKTGRPLERLTQEDRQRLLRLEGYLKERVIGQERAIAAVAQSVKRAAAGMADPRRPRGVFLFVGPTGVGKTEMAKALAQFLFDSEEHLIRLDMSEYMERHSVARLIGAPPGYIGYEEEGQLTGRLRTRPHSLVLLDEVEKAHPAVLNLFLQLFDEGRLTDAKGRRIDARDCLFVMTSNLGGEVYCRHPVGFQEFNGPDTQDLWREVMGEVRRALRPELLNRLEIVCFRALKEKDLTQIAHNLLEGLRQRLREKGVALEIAEEALQFLCRQGYDPLYGARHLQRVIEGRLVDRISEMDLEGRLGPGQELKVALQGEELIFTLGHPGLEEPKLEDLEPEEPTDEIAAGTNETE